MLRKLSITICILFVSLNLNIYAMSDATELGLDVATAITESKNISEGLKKTAKDKTSEWLWGKVGGLEKFLLFEDESKITDATKKIKDTVEIIQTINQIAISIGKGEYDTAAIATIDKVVEGLENPLTSAMWASVKLAYQSHKEVVNTQDALQVEILYNIVNRDRMLLGTADPNTKSPPTIPTNKRTADYFFDKYILTNDKARAALKSYVTTVLHDKWPQESWSEWVDSLKAIGAGVDTKKSNEIRKLDTTWRNKGRTWVIAVIKDINKQAKENWAQLKVRQEAEKFKIFAKRVERFYHYDYKQMLKEFRDLQQYKKELPLYSQALNQSKKLTSKFSSIKFSTKLLKVYNKKEQKTVNMIKTVSELCKIWLPRTLSYGSRAGLLRKKALSDALYAEYQKWLKIKDKLDSFCINSDKTIVSEAIKINSYEGNDGYYKQFISYLKDNYIKLFDWDFKIDNYKGYLKTLKNEKYQPISIAISPDSKLIETKLLQLYNKGYIETGNALYSYWLREINRRVSSWRLSMQNPTYEQPSVVKNAFLEDSKSDLSSKRRRVVENILTQWKNAVYTAKAAQQDLIPIENGILSDKIAPVNELVKSINDLYNLRKKQNEKYKKYIEEILAIEPNSKMDIYLLPKMVKSYQEALERLNNNIYTKMAIPLKFDGIDIYGLPEQIEYFAKNTENNTYGLNPEFLTQKIAILKAKISQYQEAIKAYDYLPPLTKKDLLELSAFLQNPITKNDLIRVEKIKKNVKFFSQNIIPILIKLKNLSTQDIDNRAKDASWLRQKAINIRNFLQVLEANKKIKKGFGGPNIVLPSYISKRKKYLLSEKPYRHYLTKPEIDAISKELLNIYDNSNIKNFLHIYTPKTEKRFLDVISCKKYTAAKEKNILINDKVVYASNILNAEKTINEIDPKENKTRYEKHLSTIADTLPYILILKADNYEFMENVALNNLDDIKRSKLGKEYLAIRAKIEKIMALRRAYFIKKRQEENRKESEKQAKAISDKLKEEGENIAKKDTELFQKINENKDLIKEFYSNFKEVYESKDIPSIVSLLSDDWESSADGTTVSDLENYLTNSFNVFDDIEYKISNLRIVDDKNSNDTYTAYYQLEITGYILDDDITHTEKSNVVEKLQITNGNVKILKTIGGRFWYIK